MLDTNSNSQSVILGTRCEAGVSVVDQSVILGTRSEAGLSVVDQSVILGTRSEAGGECCGSVCDSGN